MGAELLHEDGQTDMTKLIAAFGSFANAPKKRNFRIYSVTAADPGGRAV